MKILLVLVALQVFPAPSIQMGSFSILASLPGNYESWSVWGPCSRSCGMGVSKRTRQCTSWRAEDCVGPAKEYRSCNTQACPVGSRDFREEQCSQFDGMEFGGHYYTWLPYYGEVENPCELNCIPRGQKFVKRHRVTVVDGTPCYPGRRDICVEGVCKPWSQLRSLGGLSAVEDYPSRGLERAAFTWQFGDWSVCSKECGPGYQSRHVFCTSNGETVADYLCADTARPQSKRSCNLQACKTMYMYEIGEWSACSASCGKGVQTRRVQCVKRDGVDHLVVQDSLCNQHASQPPHHQACSVQPCGVFGGPASMCSLPSDSGPCASWMSRYYYDSATNSCHQFWYGGCQGNSNNFPSKEECQRQCSGIRDVLQSPVEFASLSHDKGRVRAPPKGSPFRSPPVRIPTKVRSQRVYLVKG